MVLWYLMRVMVLLMGMRLVAAALEMATATMNSEMIAVIKANVRTTATTSIEVKHTAIG